MQIKYILKRKDIILSIVILGSALPIIKFINLFFENKIKIVEKEIEKCKKKELILKKLKKIRKELNIQSKYFFAQDIQDMIGALTSILKKHPQIKTVSITPMKVSKEGKFFERISLNVRLKSDFFELIRFLKVLENHRYYINVDELTISKINNLWLDVNLKISTFKFKEGLIEE